MSKKHKKNNKGQRTENKPIEQQVVQFEQDGECITQIRYAPNGVNHDLQRNITALLHRIVERDARFTLAELGYLHANTLTYDQATGEIHLRVFFDVTLAARVVRSKINQKRDTVPVAEFDIFKGYLYVGDPKKAITYEKIMIPKGKVSGDELNRASLTIKDDAKYVETDVLVLNCNLPITLAAVHDIPLSDKNFSIRCETVGKGAKTAVKSIITTANSPEVPVGVSVQFTSINDKEGTERYNPDDAIPYLMALRDKVRKASQNQRKLEDKVRDKAKDKKKKNDKKAYSAFNKYS